VTTGGSGGTTGAFDAGSICQTQNCAVYAETPRTLYQVDPNPPNAMTELCDFHGDIHPDAGVNDIAVKRDGTLYGVTKTDLYEIDPHTCVGTHVVHLPQGDGGGFNCLTFSDQDTLIAADQRGQVLTVDINTGLATDAGRFGGGMGCSGDIVALQDGTFYATAKFLNDGGGDYLVTLDPSRGYAATRVTSTTLGFHSIFGLGYWAGTLYGFDNSGNVLAIDPVLGHASLLRNEPNTVFYGAGTTPLAPVIIISH
jgi:hypothetical protein